MARKIIAAALVIAFSSAAAQADQPPKNWWCTLSGSCHLTPIKK